MKHKSPRALLASITALNLWGLLRSKLVTVLYSVDTLCQQDTQKKKMWGGDKPISWGRH